MFICFNVDGTKIGRIFSDNFAQKAEITLLKRPD